MVGLDTTLWPSNAAYLGAAVNATCSIVNMSQDNICHCQLPQLQSSTNAATVLKHKRTLEDNLIGQKLDVGNMVVLRFTKPESQRNDSRKPSQACIAAHSANFKVSSFCESDPIRSSTIGPAPLIKTSQMLGYDAEDGSMSAGLRTEQSLARPKSRFWVPR